MHAAQQDAGQPGGVSESSSRRISAVNETLHDILLTIANEEKEEAANYVNLMKWCDTEVRDFVKSLEQVKNENEASAVTQSELEATVSKLEHELGVIGLEQRATRDEISQAENINNEDSNKYSQDIILNRQGITQLSQAIDIVGKTGSDAGFLQTGILKRLQLNQPGESSYVLGIMKRLRTTLDNTRVKLMDSFKSKQDASASLLKTKRAQVLKMEDEVAGKRQLLTQAAIDLEETKRVMRKAKDKIPALTSRLDATKSHCDSKQRAWKVRTEDRARESATIREAITYLLQSTKELGIEDTSGQPGNDDNADMFLQLHSRHRLFNGNRQASEVPLLFQVDSERSSLTSVGTLQSSAVVGDLSVVARARTSSDVKEVIQKMVSVLQQQQASELDAMKLCKANLETKGGEKAKTKDDIERLDAAINYTSSEVETLSQEVQSIEEALQELKRQLDKAMEMRKKELNTYNAHTKDRKLALKVLKQAGQLLKQFYETTDKTAMVVVARGAGTSVLQLGKPPGKEPPKSFSGSSRKTFAGKTVLNMLDKIRDEIALEQRSADSEEKDAVASFEKLQRDSKTQFDDSMSEITTRMKRRATMTVELSSDKDKKAQEKRNLESIVDQLQGFHSRCDELLQHYQQRTEARNFDLNQFRDVVDILSGSQIAVRTGLLEEPTQPPEAGQRQQRQSMAVHASGGGE